MSEIAVQVQRVKGTKVTTIGTLPPAWSAGQAKDLDEFIDLAAVALKDYQQRLGIAQENRLIVREAYPKDPVEKPDLGISLALFKVIERQHCNTTNDGSRRSWRPRHVETVEHPEDSTLMLSVFKLEMDNIVEFKIVSSHAKRANELALFFERFILAYTWFFKEMGIAQIHFTERLEDKIEEIGGNELHVRPLRFYVRTLSISQEVTRKIKEVLVHYDVGPLLRTELIDEQYGIGEHSIANPGSIEIE